MKRLISPPPESDTEIKPDSDELNSSPHRAPATPKSKKPNTGTTPYKGKQPSEPASSTKQKVKFDPAGEQMTWDADGKEALMDYLIAQGMKGVDKAVLAEKFGVTKQKIHNELSLGRAGNMRSKATKAVRE